MFPPYVLFPLFYFQHSNYSKLTSPSPVVLKAGQSKFLQNLGFAVAWFGLEVTPVTATRRSIIINFFPSMFGTFV